MAASRSETIVIDPFRPRWDRLRRVAAALKRGEIAAIPTDTVYGLAADPFNPRAVARVFAVKRRPEMRPLLLLADSIKQLNGIVEERSELCRRLAAAFWPGPLTLILPATAGVPRAVTAGSGTVAVRLPAAAIPRALARLVGRPLTGTSANRSGRAPAVTARQVERQFGRQFGREIPYIVDGGRARRLRPSTIVDLSGAPRIVREGAIPRGRLEVFWR